MITSNAFTKGIHFKSSFGILSFVALKVFQTNKLIVNPGKFQSIRVRKMKQCCAEKIIRTGEKFIDDLS